VGGVATTSRSLAPCRTAVKAVRCDRRSSEDTVHFVRWLLTKTGPGFVFGNVELNRKSSSGRLCTRRSQAESFSDAPTRITSLASSWSSS